MAIGNNKILVIIPARGGSKGIPRKNIRFLAGEPLISYTIENSLHSKYIDKVIVSTDDEEIAHVSKVYGAEVLMRPDELATDEVPLDPVINNAVNQIEKKENQNYNYIITIQPTSPLLSTNTIDTAIERFHQNGKETLLSVVDDRHLSWTKRDDKYVPNYVARKNRQYLPLNYKETGGILITKRKFVTEKNRFGKEIDLIEIPKNEAIDIDNYTDWWICEKLLKRCKILIRVDGYRKIGLGHIYRTLLLANKLIDHELLFVSNEQYELGVNLIKQNNYPIKTFETKDELDNIFETYKPDIVINDILDTSCEYISELKNKEIFVVNFEDMGQGTLKADIVINALYNEKYPLKNHYWGKDYYCLRDEFYLVSSKEVKKEVKNILITFGGTDSHNYTERIINMLKDIDLNKDFKVDIILGLGYEEIDKLEAKLEKVCFDVDIKQNVKNISKYMHEADIVFTSAGRTVYELASIGIPTIVLAQNNRELRHTFASQQNGVINLGLGYEISDIEIKETLLKLMEDYELRSKCNELMLKNNLKSGVSNVLNLIFNEYEKTKKGVVNR